MTTNNNKVFTFRINNNLLESLRESSKKNKRSIAKEIEYRLEETFKNSTLTTK